MKKQKRMQRFLSYLTSLVMALSMVLAFVPPIKAKAVVDYQFTKDIETVYLKNGAKTAMLSWATNFTPVKLTYVLADWEGQGMGHTTVMKDPTTTSAEFPCSARIHICAYYGQGEYDYVVSTGAVWDQSWKLSVQKSLEINAGSAPQKIAIGVKGDSEGEERIELQAHCDDLVNVKDGLDRVPLKFYNQDNLEEVAHFTVEGMQYKYAETSYGNKALGKFPGSYGYVYLDGYGSEEEFAALQDELAGKLVFCKRGGGITFSAKANNAMKYGAAGMLLVNNVDEIINMDLSNYTYSMPVVSVSLSNGDEIKANSTYVDGDQPYYTGVINVGEPDSLNATLKVWSSGAGLYVGIDNWDALTPGATYKTTITYDALMNNGNDYDTNKIPLQGSTEVTIKVPSNVVCYDMYRLYNSNTGEHFYTASEVERDNLTPLGWQYEGIAWSAPETSNNPVYRLFNPNSGEHHYTMNEVERDNLTAVGWNLEGIGWYSDDNKGVLLYRLYNPNAVGQFEAGGHHYTPSEAERDNLISIGWRYEGIGWFGVAR